LPSGGELIRFPSRLLAKEGVAVSQINDLPECFLCRSQDLELVMNAEKGPMVLCDECGYSSLMSNKHLTLPTVFTIAS
jgi:hypothetical protein